MDEILPSNHARKNTRSYDCAIFRETRASPLATSHTKAPSLPFLLNLGAHVRERNGGMEGKMMSPPRLSYGHVRHKTT